MKPPSGYGSWSTLSSSDPSTTSTTKTQREIELEEELSATSSQLKGTQQKLKEASEQLKATQEAHDNLKQLLEKSVNNIQKQLQAQKDEMEESFDRKLAEKLQQLQSQFALQNTNAHTPPNQPRKRQDTRPSPYEAHGIPQNYTMQIPQYPMQHYYHQYHQPQTYSPNMHPHYSPGPMEHMEDTAWGKTTDQLQEPFQEDGSAEQI
jgi:sugar-specific transcriptional regulator TrmB